MAPSQPNRLRTPPLSLYIHLPWCVRKCPYCDFNSHEFEASLPEQTYIDALLADLHQELEHIQSRPIHSIFIGGGTPSLFSPEQLDRLLTGIKLVVSVPTTTEITMEANPGTFEVAKYAEFLDIGINRLSLGIQSFDNAALEALGRIHDSSEAKKAIEGAQSVGFDNLNIDLMYGLPKQSLAKAKQDLAIAISFSCDHLSYYQLTLEPNTVFYKYPPVLPGEDLFWEIHSQGLNMLSDAGYQRYEISAFAKEQSICTHNLNYWRYGDYLGIGAGAHGKVTDTYRHGIIRTQKVRQPESYLRCAREDTPFGKRTSVPPSELAFEYMLNQLRLFEAFSARDFEEKTGIHWSALDRVLELAENRGLIRVSEDTVQPTELGYRFHNDLVALFMEPS